MMRVRWEAPSTIHCSSWAARAGLDSWTPSTHRAMTLVLLGSLARRASPSLASAPSTWVGVGCSGSRTSGSSVTVSLQKAPRRF